MKPLALSTFRTYPSHTPLGRLVRNSAVPLTIYTKIVGHFHHYSQMEFSDYVIASFGTFQGWDAHRLRINRHTPVLITTSRNLPLFWFVPAGAG